MKHQSKKVLSATVAVALSVGLTFPAYATPSALAVANAQVVSDVQGETSDSAPKEQLDVPTALDSCTSIAPTASSAFDDASASSLPFVVAQGNDPAAPDKQASLESNDQAETVEPASVDSEASIKLRPSSGEEQVFQYYRMERVYNSDAADCLIETRVTYYYDPPTETEEEGVYTEEELAALTPEERETYLDGLLAENKTSGIISTSYTVKTAAVLAAAESEDEAFAPVAAAAEKLKNNTYQDNEGFTANDYRAREIMQQVGRDASSNIYYSVRDSFLWVNNIWEPDVSYEHPVKMPNVTNSLFTQEMFNELTYNLSAEKAAPNGYFILIILSIGFMFLSQFIISRSQKAQNELQTADGRGKKTQKIMMIVMPVIYGIFAFFYSAAFTIYMITSSVYNVVSTLIINAIIDRRFRKREEQEIQDKYNKRLPQHAASGAVSKASAGTNNRQSVNKQLRQNKLRISEKEKKSADTNREMRNGGK